MCFGSFSALQREGDSAVQHQCIWALWNTQRPQTRLCTRANTPWNILRSSPQARIWGIYLWTRSDGRLFNLAFLKAKTKVRKALTRDMLFADDAVFAAHTQQDIQSMKNRFSQACKDFGLTIGLKKTNVMRQDARSPPATTINNFKLDSVHLFTYLGSTSPWTLRSIRGSERRLQDTLASHFVCGQTPSWPWRQRWLCTMPAFLAPYCMAVTHGSHMPDRKRGSTPVK